MIDEKSQEPWPEPRSKPENLSGAPLQRWQDMAKLAREAAQKRGWSKSEFSRQSSVATGTFSQWYDGTYAGVIDNVTGRIEQFLQNLEAMSSAASCIPKAPDYTHTPTTQRLVDTLLFAQTIGEMAIVTLGAGMGKSITASFYRDTRPNVHLVTMRPSTSSSHGMLLELATALDVVERNPAKLDRTIGEKLKRNGRQSLLIVDEAQHLKDNAINQLRFFMDQFGCGLALLGNEELYGRFGGSRPSPAYAQLHRRIGARLKIIQPAAGDIDAILAAWSIVDKEVIKLAHVIGKRPGAIGGLCKTLQLAGMYAAGDGTEINRAYVVAAWENRAGETV